MTKKTNNLKKLNKISLIISIIIIIFSFYLQKPLYIRPILWLIAIVIFLVNLKTTKKVKNSTLILTLVLCLSISIVLDGIGVILLKRIPVFSYNIISTENARVYNGVGIRVWQCNKDDFNTLIVDPFYKKGYMCDAEDLAAMDVNSFLNSVIENHNDYKNNYIKINGKISKKNGQNYIEMKPYEESEITINGYVNFADNITLRIIFKESESILDNYDVYDEITIVGIIKNLENINGKYVIYMYDSKVVSATNLNEFTISATSETKCEKNKTLIYRNETNEVYTYCLEEIVVTYSNDNKYELSTALSSSKLSVDNLKVNPSNIEVDEETNNTIYRYDDYSIMFCNPNNSKDIIIGNKNMKFTSVTCNIIENEQ